MKPLNGIQLVEIQPGQRRMANLNGHEAGNGGDSQGDTYGGDRSLLLGDSDETQGGTLLWPVLVWP